MDEGIVGCMDRSRVNGWLDVGWFLMEGWMDGWKDGWMNGWTDGELD